MKPTIDNLQATFKLSYDSYQESRDKANLIYEMFHNKQYSEDAEAELRAAGRPVETFNVIKLFTRQLTGYYSTVVNTVVVNPVQENDIVTASILNDVIKWVDNKSNTESLNEKLRLDCLLSGLMVSHIEANPKLDKSGIEITDDYGRKEYEIIKHQVPSREILLDPMSTMDDYSDARYIHRYRWVTEETARDMFSKRKVDAMDAFSENIAGEVFDPTVPFQNVYADLNNYLIVHSIMVDKKNTYSIWWHGDTILSKKRVNHNIVKFPYQVVKLQDMYTPEYYGIFEDVYESQLAINQAITQIQLLVNSNKVAVRKGSIPGDEWEDFKTTFARVNAVFELDDLDAIKIFNMGGDIIEQYTIIDRAFDRVQRVLGVNDSFLGTAFASDSGRKVKLQQNATLMALRYIDVKMNLMFKLIGIDTVNLIQQYMRSNQVLRITDGPTGEKWITINQPLVNPETGEVIYHEEIDPETGKFLTDEYGNYILTPLNVDETDLEFTDVDVEFTAVPYNDDDEKNQLILETMLGGNIGLELRKYNPAGFLKASSLVVRSMKSKHSGDIQKILEDTSRLIAPQQQNGPPLDVKQEGGQSANSQSLKLPQNTNEGV